PIHAEDDATSNFKLISLDLSSNNISDVSILFTEDIISSSNLTTLDISDNNICDISNVLTLLQDQFSGISISSATQSCPDDCIENGSEPLMSHHKTCRKQKNGGYAVECWNGYYYDSISNSCIEATTNDEQLRCQVCEHDEYHIAVMENGASVVTCGCREGWWGDYCDKELVIVNIIDSNLRNDVCIAAGYSSECDVLTSEDLYYITTLGASKVDTFEGMSYAVNLTSFFMYDTNSSTAIINTTEIGYLPPSITSLTLNNMNLADDTDFSLLPSLSILDVSNNLEYSLIESGLFPDTLTSIEVSSCTKFEEENSFSFLPSTINTIIAEYLTIPDLSQFSPTVFPILTTLQLGYCSISDLSGFRSWTSSILSFLDLSNNKIIDPSPLYELSGTLRTLDLSHNEICGMNTQGISNFKKHFASATSFSLSSQDCFCSDAMSSNIVYEGNNNIVCSETASGSNNYFTTCSRYSIATYTSATSFTCDTTYMCSGGCSYGQECHLNASKSNGECVDVIADYNLHSCVADLIGSNDKVNEGDGNYKFSVASLKSITIPTLNCSSKSVESISGLEHIGILSSLDLSSNSTLSDVSVLSTLTNVTVIDMSDNISYNVTKRGTFPSSLKSLNVSGCTSLIFPDFFGYLKTSSGYSLSLTSLMLSSNDLYDIDLSDLSNMKTLNTLKMSGCKISDISFINTLSELEELDMSNNFISDPSPLYASSTKLTTLNLSNNYICGMDSDGISEFKKHFSNTSFSLTMTKNDQTCNCSELSSNFSYDSSLVCIEMWNGDYGSTCCASCYHNSYVSIGSDNDACVLIDDDNRMYDSCYALYDDHERCMGYGENVTYRTVDIECLDDWYGDDCNSECPVNWYDVECSGSSYGTCHTSTHECECIGDTRIGSACQLTCDPSIDCSGHGTCAVDSSNGTEEIMCVCQKAWTGYDCASLSIIVYVFLILICIIMLLCCCCCCCRKKQTKEKKSEGLTRQNQISTSKVESLSMQKNELYYIYHTKNVSGLSPGQIGTSRTAPQSIQTIPQPIQPEVIDQTDVEIDMENNV
ncbi:hypothetical protein ADUPG1_009240, partial [Aduncisulcus paluster]